MLESRQRRRAFTLVELLVVIGIIAVLIAVLLPALNKARKAALKVNCASNLRNLGQACFNYATNNRGVLPAVADRNDWGTGLAGNWMWDMTVRTRDAIVKSGGDRHTLYCPSYKEQDVDGLWNYAGITVGGYSFIFERVYLDGNGKSVSGALRNKTSNPSGNVNNCLSIVNAKKTRNRTLRTRLGERPGAELELAADTVLSQNPWGPPFSVPGGYSVGDFRTHTSSHVGKDGWPEGMNTLYLDGHVVWREFPTSLIKNTPSGSLQGVMELTSPIAPRHCPNNNYPSTGSLYFWW